MSITKTALFAAAAFLVASPLVLTAAKAERSGDLEVAETTVVKSDRIGDAFRLVANCDMTVAAALGTDCAGNGTPHLPRFITVERRDEQAATSTLVRVPVTETANR
ncbi:hypothetical protein [Methyloraptor flagellatus]|uniref:UrcA family protein n=1 Tax=Methyloraptor flagellatus TaxID=3162530 RepID=A0AAU7XFV6_9HYPH